MPIDSRRFLVPLMRPVFVVFRVSCGKSSHPYALAAWSISSSAVSDVDGAAKQRPHSHASETRFLEKPGFLKSSGIPMDAFKTNVLSFPGLLLRGLSGYF
jgi:hypothetical protein